MQLFLAAGLMAGVAAMLRWGPSLGIVPVLAVVALALGLWRRPKATVAGLVLLAFGLGMVRAATHQSVQPPSIDSFEQGIEVHLTGRIVRPPDIEKRRPLTLDIRSADPVYAGSDSSRAVGGRVDVYSFSPLYSEGQELDVSGILRLYDPPPSDPRRFPIGRIDRPVVEIRPGSGGGATGLLAEVRNRVDQAIKLALPEPHSALLSAILLGIRSEIPRPLMNDMNAAGLTHLIAISGYNVTLLAIVIRRLAGVLLGRRAIFVVMALLPVYAILVGADPPVVRATIMAELVLFAWIVGRESHLLTTLMLSAAAMTLVDPEILGQASFQLSFVATLGLVTLAPRISAALGFMPRLLAEVIAVAVAAQILVSPLLAVHFGRLSLLAVPANVMATPVSPLVMSSGALTSFWSLTGLPGRELVGLSAWMPLEYLIWLSRFWGSLPLSQVRIPPVPEWTVALSYVAIGGLIWFASRRSVRESLERFKPRKWIAGTVAVGALLVLPSTSAIAAVVPDNPGLRLTVLLYGRAPTIYGRTESGANFVIAGSAHSSYRIDRLFPFHDSDIDVLMLRDTGPSSTNLTAAVAERRKVFRVWAVPLDMPDKVRLEGPPPSIGIDPRTTVEVLWSPGRSADPALRINSNGLSILIPPLGAPPIDPPSAWRATVLLLPQRYHPGYTDPDFLKRTGIETVVAANGPRGRTVVVSARALSQGTAPMSLGVRSETTAPVAFTWDGTGYTIEFAE
ncbi:MAG: ComEC/Rec2 family competence protein [Chloroflexi bacterium]|nr:ComEC/Rec2 family competence protein [Chloroflexota bacterium]